MRAGPFHIVIFLPPLISSSLRAPPFSPSPTSLLLAPTVLTQSSPPLRSVDYFYEILNRDAKRILVSHLKIPALDLPKVEKTTLGDLSALADLKASMEAAEEKPAKKPAAKKTKKEE